LEIKKRWEKAQKKEEEYHKKHFTKHLNLNWKKHPEKLNLYLNQIFGISLKFFEEKKVLEVGCGTFGLIYYLDNAKYRIGIEPMKLDGIIEDWKLQFVKQGTGEQIPFEDNSFDIVLALNMFDHVINPEKVIKECYRVLKKNGKFIITVNVLVSKAKILRPIINKFDTPHPYHFTEKEFLKMLSRFNLTYHKKLKGVNRTGFTKLLSNCEFKVLIGNLLMNEIRLIMRK